MNHDIKQLRVLVVEDHDFQRTVAIQALLQTGLKPPLAAGNGLEALKIIEQNPVDIILCDLDMPEMDGIEFIRHLASCSPHTALIISSSMDQPLIRTVKDMAASNGLQVLGSLPKPIVLERLKALFSQYLAQQPQQIDTNSQDHEPDLTEASLKNAIQADQFKLFYQPKVQLKTGELSSVEALVRWIHPQAGLISPGQFIPLMESNRLIDSLTLTLIDQALNQISTWQQQGRAIPVSVNISPVSLDNMQLPDQILAKTSSFSIDPNLLILEITESGVIDNMANALATLARLKLNGFILSIDDFGIGYSSMQQLKRIPFSELKIDRSFVHNMHNDETLRAITEANICLAHDLGMKTVAEGVENAKDWHLLTSLDCDMAQGFLIGKPMPPSELTEWEKEWHSRLPI